MSHRSSSWPQRCVAALAVTGALALPGRGLAMDGVIEINQARSLAGGVTPGDGAGFPVRLGQPGSYRLTGDLLVPAGMGGVELAADEVTLDLNGFAIRGPVPCAPPGGCVGTSAGVFAAPGVGNGATVVNGEVASFPGACVTLGGVAHVEGLVIHGCGGPGIETGPGSLVLSNRVDGAVGPGLRLGGSAFRGNTLSSVASPAFEDGRPIGGNTCGLSCTADGRPRYYLTRTTHPADQVQTACAPGFHFASIWEIHVPTDAAYDAALGLAPFDAPANPPMFVYGWAGGGKSPQSGNVLGANCNGWSVSDPSARGTSWVPDYSADVLHWLPSVQTCNTAIRVWCAED